MNGDEPLHDSFGRFAEGQRAKGRPYPRHFQDIPDIPVSTFSDMREAVRNRMLLLQRFSVDFNSAIFQLVAAPHEVRLQNLFVALSFLIPAASLVLAIVVSWWFLIGILGFFIAMGRSKRMYNSAIIRSAIASEEAFIFLYYTRQICLTSSDFNASYYWKQDT